MGMPYPPKPGMIVMCDFPNDSKAPEMVKRRPVVVLTPTRNRQPLVTVVPLSTVTPKPVEAWHLLFEAHRLPRTEFHNKDCWLKGDMIYTFGLHRLQLIHLGKQPTGQRIYFDQRFSRATMEDIYNCVLHGLGRGDLIRK